MFRSSPPVCGVLAGLILTSAVSCKTIPFPGKKEPPAPPGETAGSGDRSATILPIGTIHHVDEEGRFVLVRSSRIVQIEPGTLLTVVGDQGEAIARIESSQARKGPFLTADFVEGLPRVGQRVTMEYTPAPSAGMPGPMSRDEIQVLE